METLATRYVEILRYVECYDRHYNLDELSTRFDRNDILYLLHSYLAYSYGVITLTPFGTNFLAELDAETTNKYATKKENRATKTIAIIALIISGTVGVAQVLIALLR